MFVNTMLTEDSSGLECEAVSHTLPSCVDTLLGPVDPEDEANCDPSQHWEVLTQHRNTAVRTSDLK